MLEYRCGADEGAPENVGFSWNSFPATAGPPPHTMGLPPGIVLYLHHSRGGDQYGQGEVTTGAEPSAIR